MADRRLGWLGAAILAGGLLLMAAGAAVGGGAPVATGPGAMMGPGGMMGPVGTMHAGPHSPCWGPNQAPYAPDRSISP